QEPRGRGVALAGRARAPAPEVVEGKGGEVAVAPGHDDAPRALLVADLDRLGIGAHLRGRGQAGARAGRGQARRPSWASSKWMPEIFQVPSSRTRSIRTFSGRPDVGVSTPASVPRSFVTERLQNVASALSRRPGCAATRSANSARLICAL